MAEEHRETKGERRERKLAARRERMQKHGASLRQVYANAVVRRLQPGRKKG